MTLVCKLLKFVFSLKLDQPVKLVSSNYSFKDGVCGLRYVKFEKSFFSTNILIFVEYVFLVK